MNNAFVQKRTKQAGIQTSATLKGRYRNKKWTRSTYKPTIVRGAIPCPKLAATTLGKRLLIKEHLFIPIYTKSCDSTSHKSFIHSLHKITLSSEAGLSMLTILSENPKCVHLTCRAQN